MSPKVIACPVDIKGRAGLDILVLNPAASVADYITAVDAFIREAQIERPRSQGSPDCFGCYACCQERIPLTSIDYTRLFNHLLFKSKGQPGHYFLDKISHISVAGRQVDITMRLEEDGTCTFLERNKGLCSIYPIRPLVCHLYICVPLSKNAMDLKELVVNLGEDELVRLWLKEAVQVGEEPAYHEGDQPDLHIEDWVDNPFSGTKDYRDVLLKDLCPPELWARLLS